MVPLGSRIDTLEKVVEKLSLSLVTFTDKITSEQALQKICAPLPTLQVSGGVEVNGGSAVKGPAVTLQVPALPSASTWAAIMAGQDGAGTGRTGDKATFTRPRLGSNSVKRKAGDEAGGEAGF